MNTAIPVDYPAAHSMDTWWFAVDADGEIASMDTGETGLVPREPPAILDSVHWHLASEIHAALNPRLAVDSPDDDPSLDLLGLHVFQAEWALRYARQGLRPAQPLRLADLPPELAARLAQIRLPTVRFSEVDAVYPGSLVDCRYWGEHDHEHPHPTWFGVDAAGHAAVFRARGGRWQDIPWVDARRPTLVALMRAFPRGDDGIARLARPAGEAAAWLAARGPSRWPDDLTVQKLPFLGLLFELTSGVTPQAWLPEPELDVLRLDGEPAIFFLCSAYPGPPDKYQARILSGAFGRASPLDEDEVFVDVLGLALYESDSGGAGSYVRRRLPARPADARNLPPRVWEMLSRIRWPGLRFDEAPQLAPGDAVVVQGPEAKDERE